MRNAGASKMISPGSVFLPINEAPHPNEGPEKKEKWNQMGEWQFWKLEGQIIAKTSCGKSKGNVLGTRKRTSEKRERKKLSFTEGIFLLVT